MSKIEAVIFDLGRVLINIDTSKIAKFFGKNAGETSEQTLKAYLADDIVRRHETGLISPHEFYRQASHRCRVDIEYARFIREYCDIFAPMEGMEQVVRRVHDKMPIGLLSDTGVLHWEHIIKSFPWLNIFTQPALSFQTGFLKPDARAYKAAADSIGAEITSCLFIDDLPANVQGAIDAGMMAIRFEGVEKLTRQLEELLFDA